MLQGRTLSVLVLCESNACASSSDAWELWPPSRPRLFRATSISAKARSRLLWRCAQARSGGFHIGPVAMWVALDMDMSCF